MAEKQDFRELTVLQGVLSTILPGPIPPEAAFRVEKALNESWSCLKGGEQLAMRPYKILNRAENLEWDPPFLRFQIERHGGASLGSVYAEMQEWNVNVETGIAYGGEVGKRLIGKRQPPFRTGPLAAELADLMLSGKADDRLQRSSAGRYRITSAALPGARKQTTEGRRKRLGKDLAKILEPKGWKRETGGWWPPPASGSEGDCH